MNSRDLFDQAIETVLAHEGEGVSDHPNDRGGVTKFGLSKRWHQDLDVAALTRAQAIELYWERHWQGQGYDRLPGRIAVKVFDLAVNMGKGAAVRCLQRALRACGKPVKTDGVLGPNTWTAANSDQTDQLLAALRSEAAGEYRLIVARDASQAAFVAGWENRAYA